MSCFPFVHILFYYFSGEGGGKGNKKRKRTESESSEEGSDEDKPRKRGRPRMTPKEVIKGFTDAEVSSCLQCRAVTSQSVQHQMAIISRFQ